MKAHLLLLCFLISYLFSFAQPDVRNLGFEFAGTQYNPIYPWTRSFYSRPAYRVTRDSTVFHSGHYSLRVAYDTIHKDISGGTTYNQVVLDVIGRKLRFSAYVKQSNPDDTAGFVSCVISQDMGERKTAAIGFPIIHAKDWTLYAREFDLDSFNLPIDHLRLNIGTNTKDTVWVDDMKIEVDGKDTYSVSSFASARNEVINPFTEKQINNLQLLCQVWGFLKYFHPAVASGKYNWDMELFSSLISLFEATDDVNDLLYWQLEIMGDVPACPGCTADVPDNLITYNVDLKWMKSSLVNDSLRRKLEYILANRHKGDGYYAQYRYLKNLDFFNENSYHDWREIAYPNILFRMQFLFRYWNMIQYFYPYKNLIGKDWNLVLREFIPRFAEAKDLISYHIVMMELVNSVNDSHSGFWDPLLRKDLVPFVFPAKVTIINNKAVITSFSNDSLAIKNGLQVGDVIEKIDGKTIKQIIDERIHLINGSNYTVKLAYLCSNDYITGGRDSITQLEIRRDDKPLFITARRYAFIPFQRKKEDARWKILPDNIGYVNMGLLEVKNVDSMFRDLMNTKALIFDLRRYPRSTVNSICNYLYAHPTPFAKTMSPNLDYPGTFAWKGNIIYGPTEQQFPHYSGKVIILVNENTQSQAEWTTMAFQVVPGAITIGSQTSGTDGDVSTVYLTGDYQVNMTGLGVFYPDGTPTQQTGVKIDIIVHPTVKGIREGRDEVLEKAITILK